MLSWTGSPAMTPSVSTFLSTAVHFVLARSSTATIVVLPPAMAAFPFVPVVAYTLIVSAFSYISARVFKRFKPTFDVFAFLRRKGRFSPLPVTHSEHELLPTTTVSPLPPPSMGVFVGSSNVPSPRTSSFDTVPVPPRLISPPSSPRGRAQPRREPRSLATFPVLEPTIYRHRPRRSRSLGIPIPRPNDWPLQFPPSPPSQQTIIDGDIAHQEENIPLATLSQNVGPAPRSQLPITHFPYELQAFTAAPGLSAPSMSAPTMLLPQPHSSPLIDVSPTLTLHSSSTADSTGMSSASSGSLPPYSPPSGTESSGSYEASSSSLDSYAGVQHIGAFAYDWGFEHAVNVPRHNGDGLSGSIRGSSSQFKSTEEELDFDVVCLEDQGKGEIEGELVEPDIEIPQSGAQARELILPQRTRMNSPEIGGAIVLSPPSPSVRTTEPETTPAPPDNIPAPFIEDAVTGWRDGESEAQQTLTETRAGPQPSSPPVPDAEGQDEEGLSIFINSDIPFECSEVKGLSPAKEGSHFSPLSPTQIPTPPASPPLGPMPLVRSFTVDEKAKPRVAIMASSISAPISPKREIEGIHLHDDNACLEEGHSTLPTTKDTAPDGGHLPTNLASKASSPSDSIPAWSLRATDAPSIGLSASQAATVQEEVNWPRRSEKTEGSKDQNKEVKAKEPVPEPAPVAKGSKPVKDSHVRVQAPTADLKSPLPDPITERDPRPAQKDLETVSAPSTVVAPVVVATGMGRRRNVIRGLPIEVALAMQMRPGLGVGADPAWMVRFLMAVFGWFAIMIAGRGGEVDVYAL